MDNVDVGKGVSFTCKAMSERCLDIEILLTDAFLHYFCSRFCVTNNGNKASPFLCYTLQRLEHLEHLEHPGGVNTSKPSKPSKYR